MEERVIAGFKVDGFSSSVMPSKTQIFPPFTLDVSFLLITRDSVVLELIFRHEYQKQEEKHLSSSFLLGAGKLPDVVQ